MVTYFDVDEYGSGFLITVVDNVVYKEYYECHTLVYAELVD